MLWGASGLSETSEEAGLTTHAEVWRRSGCFIPVPGLASLPANQVHHWVTNSALLLIFSQNTCRHYPTWKVEAAICSNPNPL